MSGTIGIFLKSSTLEICSTFEQDAKSDLLQRNFRVLYFSAKMCVCGALPSTLLSTEIST